MTQKKYREALLANGDLARQSRELARIRRDAPIDVRIEAFRYEGPNRQACFELFGELGFRSLLSEFAPTAATVARDYGLVETIDAVEALAAELKAAGRIAIRTFTTAGPVVRAELVGIAFAARERQARYVPLAHHSLDAGPQPDRRAALAALKPLLEDQTIEKVGHDLKLDAIVLARYGVALRGLTFDTMLASYLLDATRSAHPLEDNALEHLGYKALTEEDVLRARREGARLPRTCPRRRCSTTRANGWTWRCSSPHGPRRCSPRPSSTRSTAISSCR